MLHTAYHIAEDPKCDLAYPCGVCGVNPAAQYAANPDQVDGCPAYLATSKGVLAQGNSKAPKFVVDCKRHGQMEFSVKTTSKSVTSNPCTNHVVRCPACPSKPIPSAFWSYAGYNPESPYGMTRHWKQAHTNMVMPEDPKAKIAPADGERAQVQKQGAKKSNRQSKEKSTQVLPAGSAACSHTASSQEAAASSMAQPTTANLTMQQTAPGTLSPPSRLDPTESNTPWFDLNDPALEAFRVQIWNRRVVLGNPQHLAMQDSESQVYWNRFTRQMVIEEAARLVRSYASREHPMILVPLQISVAYLLGFKIAVGGSWNDIARRFRLL